jgi:cobalamin biosynthetic protein CobC
LLPLVASLVRPGRAAVLAPTYSEHKRAAALAGHRVEEVCDFGAGSDAALAGASLAIVTHPNNPDGRLFRRDDLIAVAKKLQPRGSVLVVDEAFMDVGPSGASLAADLSRGNIVVLRSFGKFFGLAGIRLGFALAAPALAARLAAMLGPWAVSGPAIAVGAKALADRQWIEQTKIQLAHASRRLDDMLTAAALDIVGGTTLFRLVRSPAAKQWFDHLGRCGILVRRFPDNAMWLRFGLPAAEADWQRLQIAMDAFGVEG